MGRCLALEFRGKSGAAQTPGLKKDDVIETLKYIQKQLKQIQRGGISISDDAEKALLETRIGHFLYVMHMRWKGDKLKEADFIFGDREGRALDNIIRHIEWLYQNGYAT